MTAEIDTMTSSNLVFNWGIIFDSGTYYVDERLGGDTTYRRWGPLPSKELACALIEERKKWVRESINMRLSS
jgi:hypothetical protein